MTDTNIDQLLRTHELVREEIATRLQMLEQHAMALHARLDALNAERKALSEKQRALDLTGEIYRDLLPTVTSASASETKTVETKRPRARIGRQRYLMLFALRLYNGLPFPLLAELTGFPAKRVRDQMASDVQFGNVMNKNEVYLLTPAGLDLLERHEAYKRSRGEALPILGERVDDDEDDADERPASHATEFGGTTEGEASAAEDMDF